MTDLEILERIQRRVLWLSAWMVHAANARPSVDGLKVGGHQASSASVVSLLTALYFQALRPDDVVAVKAHASPAFYAIQYLRGRPRRSWISPPARWAWAPSPPPSAGSPRAIWPITVAPSRRRASS